jgi:hypothetical protein
MSSVAQRSSTEQLVVRPKSTFVGRLHLAVMSPPGDLGTAMGLPADAHAKKTILQKPVTVGRTGPLSNPYVTGTPRSPSQQSFVAALCRPTFYAPGSATAQPHQRLALASSTTQVRITSPRLPDQKNLIDQPL